MELALNMIYLINMVLTKPRLNYGTDPRELEPSQYSWIISFFFGEILNHRCSNGKDGYRGENLVGHCIFGQVSHTKEL